MDQRKMSPMKIHFLSIFFANWALLFRLALATASTPPSSLQPQSALGHLTGCGFPGSFLNSKVFLQQPVALAESDGATHFPIPVGSTAVYSCEEPYITLGEAKRVCQPDFTWSGTMPFCGLNVAMHKPMMLPADRFAWLTNDGIISTRARDCYAHSSQAGATFTWRMDLTESYQIHSVRILALADFPWSANVTVQTISSSGVLIDVNCGKIEYTGSDQTAAVSLPCRKIVPVRWIRIDFSLGGGNGRLRLCEVNVLAIDALTSEFCPQEASAKAVVGNSCLSFHSHGRATWGGALQTCRKLGGSLMQDIGTEEQSYLQVKLQYLHRFQQTDAFYWIGLFRSVNFTTMEDHWLWTNGLAPATQFWAANQPDKVASKQFCTGMSGKTGWLWNDFNCESGQGFWICRTNFTSCPIPEQPANGLITMLDRRLGGLVNYRCEEGFELIGVTSRTCQSSGTWSGLLPQCLASATQPMAPLLTTPAVPTTGLVRDYPSLATLTSGLSHVTSIIGTSSTASPTLTTDYTTSTSGATLGTTISSTPMVRASIMVRSSGFKYLTVNLTNEATSSIGSVTTSTEIERSESSLTPSEKTYLPFTTTSAPLLTDEMSFSTSKVPLDVSTVPLKTSIVPLDTSTVPLQTTKVTLATSKVPFLSSEVSVNTSELPRVTSSVLPSTTAEYFAPAITLNRGGSFTRLPASSTLPTTKTQPLARPSTRTFSPPLGINSPRCKQVPMLFNGHYTVDMLGPMLVARYSCNPGFNLVGLPFLTCTPDGSWRGMMPLCIPGYGATQSPRTTQLLPTWHVEKLTTKSPSGSPNAVSYPSVSLFTTTVPMRSATTDQVVDTTAMVQSVTTAQATMVPTAMQSRVIKLFTPAPFTTVRESTVDLGTTVQPVAPLTTITQLPMVEPVPVVSPSVRSGFPQLRCPPFPLVEYAETLFHGHKVLFRCLPGYALMGSNVTTCLLDGTWDSFPKCLPVDCGQPEKLSHGMAVLVNATSTYGSLAAYTCNGQMVTLGIYYRICSENGRWEGPVPDCSIEHPALAPAESRQNVEPVSSGLMTIIMGVVGTVGAVTIVVAVTLSIRWLKKRESVPVATSPTAYSLSSEHSPRALMTERSSANLFPRARYVPSTASSQSGYDFNGSISDASTRTRTKRNVSM